MRGDEPIVWAGTIAPPSITPAGFCALVAERATTSALPGNLGISSSAQDGPDPSAGIHLKYTVQEYLEAFRTLHVTPRPCKHWLGSEWQRGLAELHIEKKSRPDAGKAQQGAGAHTSLDTKLEVSERSEVKAAAPSTGGMDQAFMEKLITRKHDELAKTRAKAEGEKREQERLKRTNAKVLTCTACCWLRVLCSNTSYKSDYLIPTFPEHAGAAS